MILLGAVGAGALPLYNGFGNAALQTRFDLTDLWPGFAGFGTHGRPGLLLAAFGTTILVMGAVMIWQGYRRRVTAARHDIAVELIDSMPVGLILIGADGKVVYVNDEIVQATPGGKEVMQAGEDYTHAIGELIDNGVFDLQGRTRDDTLSLMTVDGLRDGFRQEFLMASGASFIRTTRRLRGGETLLVRQDVTEERARLTQIEKLNRSLSDQVRIANANNADLRAFAYATSHDLKSPANTAIMLTDALRQDLSDRVTAAEEELLGDLSDTLTGMVTLIDEVLCYTDTLGTEMQTDRLDLNLLAGQVLLHMRDGIAATGARITCGPLPRIEGNEAQMLLLFQHLLSNALKFRSADRTPEITLSALDDSVDWTGFRLSDNGIGIAPEHHGRVFQLFQRLHPTSVYKGAGLGLAICHRIVLNHSGRIEIASRPGQGTTFTLRFRKDLS